MTDVMTNVSSHIHGQASQDSSISAYLVSSFSINWIKINAYLFGGEPASTSVSVYLNTNMEEKDSVPVYIGGFTEDINDYIYAYCYGVMRDSIPAHLEGVYMAQVDYIWLKADDASIEKKFRVLHQDYDDGTLEKSEDLKKTIGGGIDHSVGAIYKTWSMIIRVRHTETEADYGDLQDLEDLYSLNNPGGTPSNDLIFIDHHQVEYTVHTVGKMTKNLLGCEIEGADAWYLYRLQLMRVQ